MRDLNTAALAVVTAWCDRKDILGASEAIHTLQAVLSLERAPPLEEAVRALLAVLPQPDSRVWPAYYARLQIEAVRAALAGGVR